MINIQNIDDNECLNTADPKPARITKADKDFAKKLDFKDIKFPVKIRDIDKSKKKRIPPALVLLAMKTKKNI